MAESSGSEDDEDTHGSPLEPEAPDEVINPKAEREEKLRQMMENDGRFISERDLSREGFDRADSKSVEEDSLPVEATEDSAKPAAEEPTVTVSNGRRRGKRKTMKKRRVQDADGFLGELACCN